MDQETLHREWLARKEVFEEWKDGPLTQTFLQMLGNYADMAKDQFRDRSWSVSGALSLDDQLALGRLKARAELAEEIADMDFETYEEFKREG